VCAQLLAAVIHASATCLVIPAKDLANGARSFIPRSKTQLEQIY
jgi:hypothetical protein